MAKYSVGTALFLTLLLVFTGTASAHVTVAPAETTQGAYEIFTVRVPTEKESATTKVELIFPEDVAISRVQPLPGWQYEFGSNAEGNKSSIVWTADGPGLANGEFGEFKLQGKVADDAKELVWKAVQTYADGSIVEWTGGAEAETPASVTKVASSTGAAGHQAADTGHHAAATSSGSSGSNDSSVTSLLGGPAFYVSLVALIAGIIALSISLRRRAKALT
ncbi:DUF1775 domain-containing protein [Paenibacillaceae bacterium]|nr:DUF1775 domain-containing protein [Paenibacillaceae bacterium]